jgi:hypothetical protein
MPTYYHGMKKEDVVRMMLDNGRTTAEIASAMSLSVRAVSYYVRKLGRSRYRRRTSPLCPVCLTNERDVGGVGPVCRNPQCIGVLVETMTCAMPRKDAERKIILELYSIDVPMDTFVICTRDDVHRLFRDAEDHLFYHAQRYRKSQGLPAPRPPTPLWIDQGELCLYRDRIKEMAYARRNRLSEYPQPRDNRDTVKVK